jgi:two-component system NtrC family sensor kinase
MKDSTQGKKSGLRSSIKNGISMPIAHKLVLSFILVSVLSTAIFTYAGIRLMANRVVAETQDRIRNDLNAAREIYTGEARHINDVVRLNARRPIIQEALLTGDSENIENDLINVKESEALDFLTLTDENGNVVMRTNYPYHSGDNLAEDDVINTVMNTEVTVNATTIIPQEELQAESSVLAEKARFNIIDTPMARPSTKSEETSGMAIVSASPVFDDAQNLIGYSMVGSYLIRIMSWLTR